MSTVKTIIDNWDPIGILSFSPADEYHYEILKIEHLILSINDVHELGEGIYNIFLCSFGEDVFRKSKSECITIAESILAAQLR